MALARLTHAEVPYVLEEERGQIVDIMLDASAHLFGKKAAIYGDPDTVLGIASLVLEMGMIPKYMLTGTPIESFNKKAAALLEKYGVADQCTVKANGDLFELHQWIKNETVDVLIGTTYGKQIAKAEDIPLVRAGFPVLDRHAHALQPIVGYKGALRLVEMILNAILDKQDRVCADEDLEIVL